MDRIGCFFLTARTFEDIESRIIAAEEQGYEACGLPSIAGRDALTTLALVAPKTSRIKLATGIVPIWTRTPVALAQEAGVLYEATGGRFMLGLGVGHEALVEGWHGTPFRKPVEAMRDYVTILRSAFRDGSVEHQGEVFHAGFGFLGFRQRKGSSARIFTVAVAALLGLGAVAGCTYNQPIVTPPGSSIFTINASSGSTTQTRTVSLTVK